MNVAGMTSEERKDFFAQRKLYDDAIEKGMAEVKAMNQQMIAEGKMDRNHNLIPPSQRKQKMKQRPRTAGRKQPARLRRVRRGVQGAGGTAERRYAPLTPRSAPPWERGGIDPEVYAPLAGWFFGVEGWTYGL